MRNRGSADTDALLCCRLDLLADFFAHVAFDVVEVINENHVIAVTDLADDGVKPDRAVFLRGGRAAVGGHSALNIRLGLSDEWNASLASNGRRYFTPNVQARGLCSFDRAAHPREHI